MKRISRWLRGFAAGERGQDMVEYALITVVISVAVVLATIVVLAPAFDIWANALATCVSDVPSCPL